MKITKELVKYFEAQQRDFGTEVAMSNLLWQNASEQLTDLGVVKLHTSYAKSKAKKGKY